MNKPQPGTSREEFAAESRRRRTPFLAECWQWLKHNKKWWLLPIIIALLLLGLIMLIGGAGLGPFIYPLA